MRLSALFSDGMVLQRGKENKIWGYTIANQKITGTFGEENFTGEADRTGYFEISLPSLNAGGPYVLTIVAEDKKTIQNVMVGDVFLLGGQSNMELPIRRVMELYRDEIEQTACPFIRMFEVPKEYIFGTDREEIEKGKWIGAEKEELQEFSAAGFFFAKQLQEKYHVPIGLLQTAVGGTPIKAWCSRETIWRMGLYTKELENCLQPGYTQLVEQREQKREQEWNEVCEKAFDKKRETSSYFLELPGLWENTGFADFCGAIRFMKTFRLTKEQANAPAELLLGTIVDADVTKVNGVEVGRTEYMYPPRIYAIAPGCLKDGVNEVEIQMRVCRKNGGFIPGKSYGIRFFGDRDNFLDLSGIWQYEIVKRMELLPQTTFFNYATSALYHGMLYPIRKWQTLGALFYQGESNTGETDTYPAQVEAMIKDWRRLFAKETLPFIYVQLAGFSDARKNEQKTDWAAFRLTQEEALQIPNTAMVPAYDLGEYNDLHPLNKKPLGFRLARAVEGLIFGEAIEYQSPKAKKAVQNAEGKIEISFAGAEKGLFAGMVLPGNKELESGVKLLRGTGAAVHGIEVLTKNSGWELTDAVIYNDGVVVYANLGERGKMVRFAYKNCPSEANLYSLDGLPVLPFVLEITGGAGHSI